MANHKDQIRRVESEKYLSTIEPYITRVELAGFLKVSKPAISRWYGGQNVPSEDSHRQLGSLAATIEFLGEELSFSTKEVSAHIRSVRLDPDTYQPFTMLEHMQNKNYSLVIQTAIERSINQ